MTGRLIISITFFAAVSAAFFPVPIMSQQSFLKEGSTTHGFTLQWTQPVDELKAEARMFLHEKSGAPLLYLSCNDD
ncbi:MAG: hypothetical protein LBF88_02075, partial [Planctomycetaceae bacterium]|nr:hypothetical protein [Planctomycetaceae bacterium]